jgi:CheY-like chemotaxis protein
VTLAEDGQQAVDAWLGDAFDLVFMDMQMPVMDGLEAIRRMREHERGSGRGRTPIFMLSANAMPEHVEAARAAGADGHLAKPITPPRLIAAVAQALDGPAEAPADQIQARETA